MWHVTGGGGGGAVRESGREMEHWDISKDGFRNSCRKVASAQLKTTQQG
jgi:hypothetical protein